MNGEHEGASIWTWETWLGLSRRLKIYLSRTCTPNTAELMAMAEETGSPDVDYREVKRRLRSQLARDHQCPAQHPVFALELQVSMSPLKKALQVFPNLDGLPEGFIPVRMYLCPVCQEVYREREVEVVEKSAAVAVAIAGVPEETASASR